MLTLGLGRSSTRVVPSVGSGRYSPGPGTMKLLEVGSYQEIRLPVAECSLIRPDFLAIDSVRLPDYGQVSSHEPLEGSPSHRHRGGRPACPGDDQAAGGIDQAEPDLPPHA